MEVKLIVASGKSVGREIPVAGPKFLIGRADDCQLRPHSEEVSRHHCEIQVEQGRVLIRDLESRNGTLVNGQRVEGQRELKMGDLLQIGSLQFEVRLIVDVGGKKKPKVKSIGEAAARTAASAGSPADSEGDVANWLMEEDDEQDVAPAAETESVEVAHTEQVDVKPDTVSTAVPADKGKDQEDEKKPAKTPGKFTPP